MIFRLFPVLLLFSAAGFLPALRAEDEANAIIQAAMRYVFQETGVNDPAVTVEKLVPGFARVGVKSVSGATDPAKAFLKGGKGQWRVLLLGSGFTDRDLADLGIPASLAQ